MNPKFEAKFTAEGFTRLAPIQTAVYDDLRQGKDVLGLAPTGSGKTLAYTWPLLEQILPGDGVQLLILAPSQELASQITQVVRTWAQVLDLSVLAIIGGANVKRQQEKLKKRPEIIVGTPGRLLNLANDKKLKLHKLQAVVVDEADEMLAQKETLADVRDLVSRGPADSQLAFFSATTTPVLDELHRWFGTDVVVKDVRKIDDTQGEVMHYLIETPVRKRTDALRRLANLDDFAGLVFVKQTSTLKEVTDKLWHHKVPVASLSGEGRQVERQQALAALKSRKIKLLITTDIAARGLDIPNLPAVINYDLPRDINTYIHRSGRTGRMGATGMVINLGNEHALRNFRQILRTGDYRVSPAFLMAGHLALRDEIGYLDARTGDPLDLQTQTSKPAIKKNKVKNKAQVDTKIAEVKPKRKKKRKRDQKNKGMRRKKQTD
ncbi:DEAD/DEAH box helicase [Ligilactobacillus equi]